MKISSAPSFDGVAERNPPKVWPQEDAGTERTWPQGRAGRQGAGLIYREGLSREPYTTERESATIKVLGRATHNTCESTMSLDGPRLPITVCDGGETFGYVVRFRNVMK